MHERNTFGIFLGKKKKGKAVNVCPEGKGSFFGAPVGSVSEEIEFRPEEHFVWNTRMHQK